MKRSRYLGRGQIAVCMRSGIKCHASELVYDGRLTSLLVLPEYADPPQPQERPYVPNDLEGAPRFPVSPDVTPVVAPVLDGESVGAPTAPVLSIEDGDPLALLTWTASTPDAGDSIDSYDVYRQTDGGGYSLLASVDGDVLAYDDGPLDTGVLYEYYVAGNAIVGGSSEDSNVVELELAPPSPVYLEDHTVESYGMGGSGAQEAFLRVTLGTDIDQYPLGQLSCSGGGNFGSEPALIVDGVVAGDDPNDIMYRGTTFSDQWWRGQPVVPVSSDYQTRLTVLSGDAPTYGAVDTWLLMGFDRSWGWDLGGTRSGVWQIEIRDVATSTVQATGIFTVSQVAA